MDRPDLTDLAGQAGSSAHRPTVASYESYPEAQADVDALADDSFPVKRIAIVASGYDLVADEEIAGQTCARLAALRPTSPAETGHPGSDGRESA